MYPCKGCGKPLYYITRGRAPEGAPVIDPERAIGKRDGDHARRNGLVYFHETQDETAACLFMEMLVTGAKP